MNWVLKLGGSLYSHPDLTRLLEQARHLSQSVPGCTIVPGGGPFADQVRIAYKHRHLDESVAHQMAILGMRQYGRLLADISQLPICYTETAHDKKCAIWLPSDDPLPACLAEIPSAQLDWNFTSDSISLCLAQHIGAQHLVLLKAISLDQAGSLKKLVDSRFIMLMQNSPVKIICLSAEQWLQRSTIACP